LAYHPEDFIMSALPLELLPRDRAPEMLFILLHGYGDRPEGLLGLAGQFPTRRW
jgi:hypothetical protein